MRGLYACARSGCRRSRQAATAPLLARCCNLGAWRAVLTASLLLQSHLAVVITCSLAWHNPCAPWGGAATLIAALATCSAFPRGGQSVTRRTGKTLPRDPWRERAGRGAARRRRSAARACHSPSSACVSPPESNRRRRRARAALLRWCRASVLRAHVAGRLCAAPAAEAGSWLRRRHQPRIRSSSLSSSSCAAAAPLHLHLQPLRTCAVASPARGPSA